MNRHARIFAAAISWVIAGVLLLGTAIPSSAQSQAPAAAATQANEQGTGIVPPGVKLTPVMPAAQPPRPFHFPRVASRTLANGLRVFVVTDARQPAVAVRLVLTSAGAVRDPAGLPGVASMTANMLTQGAGKRTAQQFAEAIDFVGGHILAEAGHDSTSVNLAVVARDLDLGMDLLSDAVLHPTFAQTELDRQRQQVLSALRVEYDEPNFLASAVFNRTVYGSSPYGLPLQGTPGTVGKLTRDDLVKFHDAAYAPNGALLAFAGDITPARAFALAKTYFGSWPKEELPAEEVAAPAPTEGLRFFVIDKPDAVQTQIRVGKIGIRRDSPDYIPLLVTNRVFGGGFNSRLNTEVRVRKGLTYGASSFFAANRSAGSFVASTFTRTEETVEATKLVVDLIAKMSTGDVTPAELKFAQDYLAGVYPIQSETAEQVADRVLTVAEYGLPADYNDTYTEKILGVSQKEVNEMAEHYFNARDLDIVLVGNASKFLTGLKGDFPSAQWEEIPYSQLNLLRADLRQPAPAAPAPTPETLAHGHEILLAAIQAAGGDAIKNVKSLEVSTSGQIFAAGQQFPLSAKVQISYPDHLRVETTLPFGAATQGFDGKSGWVSSPRGTSDIPAAANAEFERGIALAGGLGLYQQVLAGSVTAQYLGEEQFRGKMAQAIEWNASFGAVKLYFDPSTHRLVGAHFKSMTPQGAAETDQSWSDFRPVEGVFYPFQSAVSREGVKFSTATATTVKLNPALDPAIFTKPGAVAPPPK